MNSNRPIILGSYSPSQNGIIVSPRHSLTPLWGWQRA
nr:MAG TPA: hypothetical protein [Caudoviricetes sp.]